MQLRFVEVEGLTLVLCKPCYCYEPATRRLIAGLWVGSRQQCIGRQGAWEFWRYIGGVYTSTSALFRTSSPAAALRLFTVESGWRRVRVNYRFVHLDDWHVLSVKR